MGENLSVILSEDTIYPLALTVSFSLFHGIGWVVLASWKTLFGIPNLA